MVTGNIRLGFDANDDKSRILDEPPSNYLQIWVRVRDENNEIIDQRVQYITNIEGVKVLYIDIDSPIKDVK